MDAVAAVATSGTSICATCAAVHRTVDRTVQLPRARPRSRSSWAIARLTGGGVDVARRDHDDGRGLRAGELALDLLVGAHDLELVGRSVKPSSARVHAERRQRQHEQRGGRRAPRGPGGGAPAAARAPRPASCRARPSAAGARCGGRAAAVAGAAARVARARATPWRAATARTPRSTLSPSRPSSAGRTVSDPTIVTNTTTIAPMPIESKTCCPPAACRPSRSARSCRRTSTARPRGGRGSRSASRPGRGAPRARA